MMKLNHHQKIVQLNLKQTKKLVVKKDTKVKQWIILNLLIILVINQKIVLVVANY